MGHKLKVAAIQDDGERDELLEQMTWLGVPIVSAAATGILRTRVPGLEPFLQDSKFSERAAQASEVWLETRFAPGTGVWEQDRGVAAFGTATGNAVMLAEVELPDAPPQPGYPQPSTSPVYDPFFEHMIPLVPGGRAPPVGSTYSPELTSSRGQHSSQPGSPSCP